MRLVHIAYRRGHHCRAASGGKDGGSDGAYPVTWLIQGGRHLNLGRGSAAPLFPVWSLALASARSCCFELCCLGTSPKSLMKQRLRWLSAFQPLIGSLCLSRALAIFEESRQQPDMCWMRAFELFWLICVSTVVTEHKSFFCHVHLVSH